MLRRTILITHPAAGTGAAAAAVAGASPAKKKPSVWDYTEKPVEGTTKDLEWYGGWKIRPVSMFWFIWNTFNYSKSPNPQLAFELGMNREHRTFRVPLPGFAKKAVHLDGEMIVTSDVNDVGTFGNKGGEYMIRAKCPPWPWDVFWPDWGWMPTSYAWLYGEETKRGVHIWRKDLLKSENSIKRFGQPLAFHTARFRREFKRTLDSTSGRHSYWLELVCCSVFDQCTQMQTGQDTKWCLRYDPDVLPSPRDWSKRVSELATEVGKQPARGKLDWYFDRTIKFDYPECFETPNRAPDYAHGRLLGDKSTLCQGKQSHSRADGKGQAFAATSGHASVKGRTDEAGNALEPWTPAEMFYFQAEATLAQLTIDVNTKDPKARIFGRSEKYDRSRLFWETLYCESERITAMTWDDQKKLGDEVPDYCSEDKCLWKDMLTYKYSDDPKYKMRSPEDPDAWVNIIMNHRRVTFLHVEIIISTFDPAGRLVENLLYGVCKYPEWQEKVAAEAKPVIERMEKAGTMTLQDWDDLKITKAFACEFLRAVPLFDVHQRTVADPTVLDNGTLVRNGSMVIVNYAAMCKQRECYPEPEVFKPERFMDLPPYPPHGSKQSQAQSEECPFAAGKINKSDAVCPFGMGERVCAGIGWARVMTLLQFAAIVADHKVTNEFALNNKLEWLNSAPNRPYPKINPHFCFEARRAPPAKVTTEAPKA